MIPYDSIDCEIRTLVRLMNEQPGIRTTSSCAGHSAPSSEAGVVFTTKRQSHLERLLGLLKPCLGFRGGFNANYSTWQSMWVQADMLDGRVVYRLRIDGYPLYVQRSLIGEAERALKGK